VGRGGRGARARARAGLLEDDKGLLMRVEHLVLVVRGEHLRLRLQCKVTEAVQHIELTAGRNGWMGRR